MIPPDTQHLLDFLSDTASYPHLPDRVTLVQPHASWVFIASPFVYKVKKPVNLGFLDFSTLALRQADCEREVELNSRLTDDFYLGVEFISDEQGESVKLSISTNTESQLTVGHLLKELALRCAVT